MQMARKVGVKIILQNSCHKLILFSPNKSACKNKTIQSHFPHIQFIPFPTLTPTHCIHIVNVDISETKWSASKVWGDTHSQSRPRLNSPSPSLILSHRHILELSTRQPQLPASTSDSDCPTKVSIYNLSLIRGRGRHHQRRKYEESTTYIGESVLDFDH